MKRLTIVFFLLLLGAGRLEALGCQLNNTNEIFFGTYSSSLIQITSGWVSINCDTGAKYTIGLGPGSHGSNVTNRLMTNGAQTLRYQLFSNASYTLNWGDASASSTEVSGIGIGQQTIPIWAQVPANQAFFATTDNTNYADIVSVTLTCSNCTVISGSPGNLGINLHGVASGCGITATDLNFGNYTGAELDATTTIQVGCSSGTRYHVGLSAGNNGADVTHRSMTLSGGGAALNYKLLRGSYRGSNWGDTIHGQSHNTDTVHGTGTGTTQNLTVYGVIPAGQTAVPGTYTDTIVATITY
jgi:spore coat protein U-like protein